jgi:DNA-binding MarR family transcriptional regulator
MGAHIKMRVKDGSDSVSTIMDSLRLIVKAVHKSSRQSQDSVGLTTAQLFVLQHLQSGDDLSINDLATLTFTHQSTVSEVVARLIRRKFIVRRPAGLDRRKVMVTLTREGGKALSNAPETAQTKIIRALQKLRPAEKNELARLMHIVIRTAEFDDDTPTLFFEKDSQTRK